MIDIQRVSLMRERHMIAASGSTIVTDEQILQELNQNYVRAFLESDVAWYDANLAEDFMLTSARGVFDKQQFLELAGNPVSMEYFRLEDVLIRVLGDVALVHARTPYQMTGQTAITNRYTDVWAKRGGEWKAVAAQITTMLATGQV
jgi:ketosteroid isomerase-like protein